MNEYKGNLFWNAFKHAGSGSKKKIHYIITLEPDTALVFPTSLSVRTASTRISLRIRAVWSESSHGPLWVDKYLKHLQSASEDWCADWAEFLLVKKIYYENMSIQIYWEIYLQKMKIFRQKNSDIFHISAQNRFMYASEPPRRGGSNEYPQSMVLGRNKKNNVYHRKPQFYYIKLGFQRVKK